MTGCDAAKSLGGALNCQTDPMVTLFLKTGKMVIELTL